MATHIVKSVAWNNPSIYKYRITLDAYFNVIGVHNHTATVRITGSYVVDQSEHDQEMVSAPASDYGFLFEGEVIPASPTTVIPGDHYMEAIPTLFGGSAEQYRDKMILEFRGDTYRSDGGNFTNLWTKSDGLIINRKFGNTSTTIPLDITITADISDGGRSPILSWATTYVTFGPTVYHWGDSVAWVSFVDLDYRPGATLDTNTGIWKSHNRTNGACHVLSNVGNITWKECRTVAGDAGGQGNPPLILHSASADGWYNQKLLGKQD